MIYEIRVYRCVPGRLPALLNRFANITLKLWEKHGIKQAGFWTTLVGESNQELDLSARLGIARRPRQEVGGLPGRSGMDRQACRDREGRRHRAQRLEPVAGPDGLLVGEVIRRSSLTRWALLRQSALRPASLATRAHLAGRSRRRRRTPSACRIADRRRGRRTSSPPRANGSWHPRRRGACRQWRCRTGRQENAVGDGAL